VGERFYEAFDSGLIGLRETIQQRRVDVEDGPDFGVAD
jgi:hypothetical protein